MMIAKQFVKKLYIIFVYFSLNYEPNGAQFIYDQSMQDYLNEIEQFQTVDNRLGLSIPKARAYDSVKLLDTYDFIIVGSGPAGCVLANRLSERSDWNILLIEAGIEEPITSSVPVMTAYLQSTQYNWGYTSEWNERYCWGMDDQLCGFPRGRGLGGTSIINYMIYNRGNPRDFNRWAEAGNYGWSYADVLPYFKKSQRANLRGKENSPFHNRYGLLSVEDLPYRSQLVDAFVQGSKEIGHAEVDYNSDVQVGVSYVQSNTLRGRRHSAARAFLDSIFGRRPNLHVLLQSRVTKVLINPQTKETFGVDYVRNKRQFKMFASKEVILSAGAFNSPQLLMLSGIGSRKQLERINVPLIEELPVGEIMYDHVSHFGPTFVTNTTGQSLIMSRMLSNLGQYLRGTGQLTLIGGVEALNFIKTPNSRDPPDFPDIELIFVSGSLSSDEGTGLRRGMRIRRDIYDQQYRQLEQVEHWSVMPMLFHPRSVGRMELKDNNPFHWPRFYPNYFQFEEDVETLLYGIKEAIRISKSPAMQQIGSRLYDVPLPNCAHLNFGTDDYWRCSIRTYSLTLHHQIGTCKMGPRTDPTTVVDPELRVHGIKRLRVADTSIVPQPPTSHTNAISFMVGEKAADMIKAQWKEPV